MAVPNRRFCAEAAQREPSLRIVLALGLISCAVFVGFVSGFEPYATKVTTFGDSGSYMAVASAIRRWNFAGLEVKQFWGLPYAMAAISRLSGMSDYAALLTVSALSSFVSLALVYRLWGGWVAALFALLNFDWMQRSFLGGSEPLFVALLFAAFLAAREDRWLWAALLGALATTVRPLGFMALLAIGATLLWKRAYRKCALSTGIGAAVGLAYVLPLWHILGDPLATVHSYTQDDGGPALFGIPFYAIMIGLNSGAPWTNRLLSLCWIVFVTAGTLSLLLRPKWNHRPAFPAELLFAGAYLLTICCYNAPQFASPAFARFAIPIVPFAIAGWSPWIPKSRSLIYALALLSPALAAASAIGIVQVAHRIF